MLRRYTIRAVRKHVEPMRQHLPGCAYIGVITTERPDLALQQRPESIDGAGDFTTTSAPMRETPHGSHGVWMVWLQYSGLVGGHRSQRRYRMCRTFGLAHPVREIDSGGQGVRMVRAKYPEAIIEQKNLEGCLGARVITGFSSPMG